MPNLAYISPFFIVANLNTAVSFYTGRLGFEVRYMTPADAPFFAIVGREEISILLKATATDIKPAPNHTLHEWARWDAFIYTADPDSLFQEYRAEGVTSHQPLQDDGDGLRGFEVTDADGYVLFFGRPVSPMQSARGSDEKNKEDLDLTFSVDSIESLYDEFLTKSIEIIQPLRDMPYGREFYIADPDGNRIAFMEEA